MGSSPATQSAHGLPVAEICPAAQSSHVVNGEIDDFPATQSAHGLPMSEICPAEQKVHELKGAAENLPAGQAEHDVAPPAENVSAVQPVQSAPSFAEN